MSTKLAFFTWHFFKKYMEQLNVTHAQFQPYADRTHSQHGSSEIF